MVLCQVAIPVPIFFGHPPQYRGPPATYATLLACEVPTSRGAATNGLEGFSPSIPAGSRGGARYPSQEAGPVPLFPDTPQVGLYKILFHFEALLHNNILCKHPLYCAIYCTILPLIASPAQF